MKRFVLSLSLVLILGGGIVYYLVQKNNDEKCPVGFVFNGLGCTSREALQEQEKLIAQKKAEGTYGQLVDTQKRRSNDALKINDIQEIIFELSRYKGKYGNNPKDLSELNAFMAAECSNDPKCVSALNYDPKYEAYSYRHGSNNLSQSYFYYAVRLDKSNRVTEYHLGTSLETDVYLDQDQDFNSKVTGWLHGFSGEDSKPCSQNDGGNGCYDIKGQ